jgi:FMN reductase
MGKIVIISGNPSKSSRLKGVLEFAASRLENEGFSVNQLEVVDLPAEDLLHAKFDSPAVKAANALVEQADAVIIATPVYKASYTGILKVFLDLIPQKGLENKKILPIAMGGTTAHLLMLEYALKPVLSVLGATHIEQGIFALDSQVKRNENGTFEIAEEVTSRLTASLTTFMNSISKKVMV